MSLTTCETKLTFTSWVVGFFICPQKAGDYMSKTIKGITIEIGGNTTPLQKALKGVNKESISLQNELKQVDKLLKFNPGNADLIAQKQKLLGEQVETTSKKLDALRQAQDQVNKQFKEGKIDAEQYRNFQRELIATESSLEKLKGALSSMEREQQAVGEGSKKLDKLFAATKSSIDDYSDALGGKLVNAIKEGKANSKQLEQAFEKVAKAALGSKADIGKVETALSKMDTSKLKKVQKELKSVAKEAEKAEKETSGLGDALGGLAGGLAAGGGIAGVIEKSLDVSSLNTKIDIQLNVPEESKKSVKEAVKGIEAYGVDGEAALEAVRRQWTLNADATDEQNQKVVKSAGMIASAYSGIDLTELIQEANEMASTFGISDEEALGLTQTLLDMGFPPEQLDIISEYGTQLTEAGYSAEEIQGIFAAGIDTGTWNIDNLLDGVKEGRIRMAEFGVELNDTIGPLLEQAGIGEQQFMKWGQAIAKGGEGGKKAMEEVSARLMKIEDDTLRNALGTQIFGTMWEDQGSKITDAILNADEKTKSLAEGTDKLAENTAKLDDDPTVQMRQAFSDTMTALAPLLTKIAEVIGKVAEWISENPKLAAAITAVVTVVGVLMGIITALVPLIMLFAGGMGAALLPVLAIAAGIAALIAVGVLLWQNWDTICAKCKEIWGSIKEFFSGVWEGIKSTATSVWNGLKSFFSGIWEGIKSVATSVWNGIKSFFSNTWNGIKSTASSIWNGIKSFFSSCWNGIKSVATSVWNGIKSFFSSVMNGIKSTITNIWNGIKSTISTVTNTVKSVITTVWNGIKSVTSSVFNGIKSVISKVWNGIKSTVSSVVNGVKSTISRVWNAIKSTTTSVWNGIKSAITKPIEGAKKTISSIIESMKKIISSFNPKKLIGGAVDKVKGLFGKSITVEPGVQLPGATPSPIAEAEAEVNHAASMARDSSLNTALSNFQAATMNAMSGVMAIEQASIERSSFNPNSFFKGLTEALQSANSSSPIVLQINLDGYEIAKATYKHTTALQEKDTARNRRFGGY